MATCRKVVERLPFEIFVFVFKRSLLCSSSNRASTTLNGHVEATLTGTKVEEMIDVCLGEKSDGAQTNWKGSTKTSRRA